MPPLPSTAPSSSRLPLSRPTPTPPFRLPLSRPTPSLLLMSTPMPISPVKGPSLLPLSRPTSTQFAMWCFSSNMRHGASSVMVLLFDERLKYEDPDGIDGVGGDLYSGRREEEGAVVDVSLDSGRWEVVSIGLDNGRQEVVSV
ncbi:uncharacterized protein A4U43_C09F12420 [Asparagus officinalis]|uniref:Uncharacterized protein n=1 Tax=Asparagus officinalis TaxID=4686 RepID=A0A5P1EA77_ASPOF|nr:uncharacterized protein A4U43_C09F12420 [Asparagus officinalis]